MFRPSGSDRVNLEMYIQMVVDALELLLFHLLSLTSITEQLQPIHLNKALDSSKLFLRIHTKN